MKAISPNHFVEISVDVPAEGKKYFDLHVKIFWCIYCDNNVTKIKLISINIMYVYMKNIFSKTSMYMSAMTVHFRFELLIFLLEKKVFADICMLKIKKKKGREKYLSIG